MMPTEPGTRGAAGREESIPGPIMVERPAYPWYQKVGAILLVTFCLEIGLFLLIFPWTDYWELNYFSTLVPQWQAYWGNSFFRGAVSGLGVINLYISLVEIFRLRRFSKTR